MGPFVCLPIVVVLVLNSSVLSCLEFELGFSPVIKRKARISFLGRGSEILVGVFFCTGGRAFRCIGGLDGKRKFY